MITSIMSNLRRKKLDWPAHKARMIEQYHDGLSIPQIHEAVLSNTFRPCLRSVYNMFQNEGLPTRHNRTSKLPKIESSTKIKAGTVTVCRKSPPVSLVRDTIEKAGGLLQLEESAVGLSSSPTDTKYTSSPSIPTGCDNSYTSHVRPSDAVDVLGEPQTCSDFLDGSTLNGEEVGDGDIAGRSADSRNPMSEFQSPGPLKSKESGNGRSHKSQKRSKLSPEIDDHKMKNSRESGPIQSPQHSGGRTRHPIRVKNCTTHSRSRSKLLLGKLRPLFNIGGNSREICANKSSPFPDNDSRYASAGHASGRGTSSTLSFRASLISHPESMKEFGGLHKVICHSFHETKYHYKYTGSRSCSSCGHSAIHDLAWGAKHIEVSELKAKLRSKEIYDLRALDFAGNSALHYAAKSGATYNHLKAFIDAGVPLDVQNTAKQNFLHCLRPCEAETSKCFVDTFKHGLLELLELVGSERVLGQQDNDGQTVLHVLALYIVEPELRDHTFKFFSKMGLSAGVIDRFGKSAKDHCAPNYQLGQTMFAAETFSTMNNVSQNWQELQRRQERDDIILQKFHNSPCYMDSDTKDTVLHALSRANMQKIEIMQYLRQSVARGVNVNRHNCDGYHPLAAFICNQGFREAGETGATMARHVDVLLWKDKKRGQIYEINVDMMTSRGTTALYEAAVRGQADTVRSLLEAGANVNARLNNKPGGSSVLHATYIARNQAVMGNDKVRQHMFKEVISHLEHAGAVEHPTSLQERGCTT